MACNGVDADMYVIRLANGNLLVPEYAIGDSESMIGDAYVEIEPGHADFARLSAMAITWQEDQQRRQRWHEGDEALRREFLDYLARNGSAGGWGNDQGRSE